MVGPISYPSFFAEHDVKMNGTLIAIWLAWFLLCNLSYFSFEQGQFPGLMPLFCSIFEELQVPTEELVKLLLYNIL